MPRQIIQVSKGSCHASGCPETVGRASSDSRWVVQWRPHWQSAVSANKSHSLSTEDEERRERKKRPGRRSGEGRQWLRATAGTELALKGLSLDIAPTSSSSSGERKGF